MNILVTSGYSRIAYNICKTLSKHGYKVFIGSSDRYSMAGVSRFCSGTLKYAPYNTEEEKFLKDVEEFIEKKNIEILVPSLEETFTIVKNKDRLQPKVKFLLPTYAQIMAIHNKKNASELAEKLGIPVPETHEAVDLLADPQSMSTLPFPVILKPKEGGGGWSTQKCNDITELTKILGKIDEPEKYMVQQFIEGQLICACAIYNNGRLVVGDFYRSDTVFPIRVGQATTRTSVMFPEVFEYMKKLLDHLKWNGVCEIDFIFEHATGKSYLLDANPRFWGSLVQNISAGVDYPYYYCQLAMGKDDFTPGTARLGTRTRWLGGDLMRIRDELKTADRKLPFIKQIFQPGAKFASHDDWDITDPLPFLIWTFTPVYRRLFKRGENTN